MEADSSAKLLPAGTMTDLQLRPIDTADRAALAALQSDVFADYTASPQLAEAIAEEAAARPAGAERELPAPFGLVAYRGDVLVGWTQGYRQGRSDFCMLNSGVAASARRSGVYTALVEAVLVHAASQGYARVNSRHAASNTAVLIAKMRLGFLVSGFEYSEVYGPLVQLSHFVGEARRRLYQARSASLRTPP